jgi:hypothetical protein
VESIAKGKVVESPIFNVAIKKEAEELAQTGFGAALIKVIGYVYVEQGQQFLGFEHSFAAGIGMGDMRRRGHVLSNNMRMARSALRTYQVCIYVCMYVSIYVCMYLPYLSIYLPCLYTLYIYLIYLCIFVYGLDGWSVTF